MGLVNSTNHIIPITRNQTILVSKTGVLYESLASVYSIDIPRLKNDGNDVGVLRGDVTGLFNRMITIPLTNDEDMSADIVQDNKPSQSPSLSTFIYLDDLKVVRNYDSTIVPVFPRTNLYNYMKSTSHILQSQATSTYSQKSHNHKDPAESEKDYKGTFITSVRYDVSTSKLIFYDGNNSVKSSIQMTDYMALATHSHYYVTSIKYDNNTSKFSYQSSGSWTAFGLSLNSILATSVHNHNASYRKGGISYTSNDYTLHVLNTLISPLHTVISLIGHTHGRNYIKKLLLGTNSNAWNIIFGNGLTTSFKTPFLTSISISSMSSSINSSIIGQISPSTHKHDAICTTSASTGTSVFYYKSSSSALISVYDIYKSSDIRLKDHIQTISSSDKLESFVKFRWKESENDSYGVIAQEVEKSHPELVNTNDEGFKSVEYQGLLCNQIGKLCEDLKEKGILTDEDFV